MKLRAHKREKATLTLQASILLNYALMAAIIITVMTFMLFFQFSKENKSIVVSHAEQTVAETESRVENYLRRVRTIGYSVYYNVIKDADLTKTMISKDINLMYESNKDSLVSIALFKEDGTLVCASPNAILKPHVDIQSQDWFQSATTEIENLHYSLPHVQNLFDNTTGKYHWVISLSMSVELTENGNTSRGVLLVDMDYSSVQQLLKDTNETMVQEYVYIIDSVGKMVYHPRMLSMDSGVITQPDISFSILSEGTHYLEDDTVIVSSIGYTGWKLIAVVPATSILETIGTTKYFVMMLGMIFILLMLIVNRFVSARVTKPLRTLDQSVRMVESGEGNVIIVDDNAGKEVRHLGFAIRSYKQRNEQLVKDVIHEQQEQKRRELDILQSQINPHFLYNTLDSIVWMIEKGDRNEDAVYMITQLASLFRISLSKGKTIIPIKDEVKHASNYVNIQKVRFKDKFDVEFDISDEIEQMCMVKLVLQPIIENAIHYGVRYMEEKGHITVRGWKEGEDIYLTVEDDGVGIPEDVLEILLDDTVEHVHSKGSGVGLINIQKRIQLRFGEAYGLKVESELDEGTKVTVHIPSIPYTRENRDRLEEGGAYE